MPTDNLSPSAQLGLSIQVLLLLCGLVVLVKLFLTKAGREAWRRPSPLAPLPWTGVEFGVALLVVLFGAVGGQIVASLVVAGLPFSEEQELPILGAGFQLGMLAGAAMAQLVIVRTRAPVAIDEPAPVDPPPLDPAQPSPPQHAPWIAGPVTLLAAIPLLTATNIGWIFLLDRLGLSTDKQDMIDVFAESQSLPVLLGMSFLAVIIAPVTEEVIFRAGLFRYLRTRLPRPVALVLPAAIFGLLHGNLVASLPLILLGVVFALAYERTGRISVPIVAHALFNLNTILLLIAGVDF
ncbi:CPBP family intramembrane glutamic endopeptidase [Actomonas aquatica]|uniref:CPBP family intramembrane glutamic endopeptidase n=1 Tax=Actomonas aquatica TaxID=2866162 RepID=A0ABZ1CBW8_9BACT|nr:CPBP family intramembrane glutamic endopeptidase [Opitutus sp. WL0086]WRQ89171.1 CPBP family intramembrane glutamic endopeptidase [Opitutus sp. WL0086]